MGKLDRAVPAGFRNKTHPQHDATLGRAARLSVVVEFVELRHAAAQTDRDQTAKKSGQYPRHEYASQKARRAPTLMQPPGERWLGRNGSDFLWLCFTGARRCFAGRRLFCRLTAFRLPPALRHREAARPHPRSPAPARNSVASSNGLPISCSPSGVPSRERPAGTEMPGSPAMFTVTVKMSSRYMAMRIAGLLAEAERGRRRRRRQHHVDRSPRLVEVALDQRAHLLRLEVVGVVVAGGEHVGADQDAPAHLLAEARRARRSRRCRSGPCRARAGRSARRRSARGWRRPRPARRCSRPAARTWCAAARCRGWWRRPPSARRCPACHSLSISGDMPSTRYSFGTPMRRPLTPCASAAS